MHVKKPKVPEQTGLIPRKKKEQNSQPLKKADTGYVPSAFKNRDAFTESKQTRAPSPGDFD